MKTNNIIQASLRVTGKVQMVGFRDAVRDAAVSLNLTGYVENNKDGSVSILCEGSKTGVEKLISAIKKLPQKDPFTVIDKIETASTKKASGRFKAFEIKRGNKDDESGIRMDTGIFLMKAQYGETTKLHGEMRATRQDIRKGNAELKEEVKQVGAKVDNVSKDVRGVGENIHDMANRMDTNFERMEKKYHVIHEEVKATNENLTKMVDKFSQLVDNFTKMVQASPAQHDKKQ